MTGIAVSVYETLKINKQINKYKILPLNRRVCLRNSRTYNFKTFFFAGNMSHAGTNPFPTEAKRAFFGEEEQVPQQDDPAVERRRAPPPPS